ncbi:hypothetical protein [Rhizohabitans arisaemae]|uniref:hypothetical protein n=1 Tax=Rhizohabitans arisaemae TaxID=2720610 RepID=UPI0024B1854F|nr:hypothetical protein [Rhizohabitans arisaemae]
MAATIADRGTATETGIAETRDDIKEVVHGQKVLEVRLDRVELRLNRVEKRLDVVEQRLDRVEQRLDRVEQRLDRVEQRLEVVEYKLERVELRLEQVAADVDKLKAGQMEMRDMLAVLLARTESLEKPAKDTNT